MKWRNGLIGTELMAAISLSAYYGVRNLRDRADAHRLEKPCTQRTDCSDHPIMVRSPKFGRALMATSVIGGLLVPYAALTERPGRIGMLAGTLAAGSLALALRLRYEFVVVDQERRDRDNALAGFRSTLIGDDDEDENDFLDSRHRSWLDTAA